MEPLVVITDVRFKNHHTGKHISEIPARITDIHSAIADSDWASRIPQMPPRMATVEEVALCHLVSYIQSVQDACARLTQRSLSYLGTKDVVICKESYAIALLAVGGALTAVDQVCRNQARRAFAAVRPPGHHAEPDRAMGFCFFNNIAIAARYAMKSYGVKKVLIIDWDVHHGNGTQKIFYEDPNVFYFSTHQWPHYPGTGSSSEIGHAEGLGTTLNIPIQEGGGSLLQISNGFELLAKKMEIFQPELVMISAGFDAHHQDPLGNLLLTEDDFLKLTMKAVEIANRYAKGRIVSVLEGGYNLPALAASVLAHLKGLQTNVPNE